MLTGITETEGFSEKKRFFVDSVAIERRVGLKKVDTGPQGEQEIGCRSQLPTQPGVHGVRSQCSTLLPLSGSLSFFPGGHG
jgi:hypothetical protein